MTRPRRRGGRLGWGALATGEVNRAFARMLFLHVVNEYHPRVFVSLREVVLPVYADARRRIEELAGTAVEPLEPTDSHGTVETRGSAAFASACNGDSIDHWECVRFAVGEDGVVDNPDLVELRDALRSWGKSWGLAEDWCLQTALRTLSEWHKRPQAAETLELRFGGVGYVVACGPAISLTLEGFDPSIETPEEYTEKVAAAARRKATESVGAGMKLARALGFVDVPRKRGEAMVAHFVWLADYVIDRESTYLSIASKRNAAVSTVEGAVKLTASLVGMDLHATTHSR